MKSMANNKVLFEKGVGIQGDVNAHPLSPRQVLITRDEDMRKFKIKNGDLRENIIVSGISDSDFVPGSELILDNRIRIRLTFYCEPCKRISHLGVELKELIKRRGILGVVQDEGWCEVGCSVKINNGVFLPLSDIPVRRFVDFINHVPVGKIVTYREVTIGMGVAESYMRAIPKYIEFSDKKLPLHRIVDTSGCLLSKVKNQHNLLKREGVDIFARESLFSEEERIRMVNVAKHLWTPDLSYLVST